MKKIKYIIFLACAALIGTSCDDFLDTSSPSKLNDATVYTSIAYSEAEVMGIYTLIADAQMYAQRISTNWCTNNDIEIVGADENSYSLSDTYRGLSNYLGASGNTTLAWDKIYSMIERANLCIEGLGNSPLLENSDATIRAKAYALLGEALTMRAMGYYELVKCWGDVPFKEEPTKPDLSNVYLPKTDRDTIYNHIIRDLEIASGYVPWLGEGGYGTVERVTKGFVKGLRARIALSAGGYSLRDKSGYPMERRSDWLDFYKIANKECSEIMAKGKHNVNPSYVDVWKKVNALKLETAYNENLYEVAFGLGETGELGYSIGVRFYTNPKYGYSNNTNVVNVGVTYFYSFDRADFRKDATVAYYSYSAEMKETFKNEPLGLNIAKWDQRWMSENAQWLTRNLAATGKWGYGVNFIVMRYSDILLMFAETENELNGAPSAEAKNALKQVRSRAFSQDDQATKVENYINNLNTKDAFFNAIVDERAWEFGGEAIRKFDLVRWNLLSAKIQEQRDAFNAMLDGGSVTISGQTYSSLPLNLYCRYKEDGENLDKENINFYESRSDLDPLTDIELKALGYTRYKWLAGDSDTNKEKYRNRIQVFSSGLNKAVNGVCDNRYLYPIYSEAINTSQGSLKNSYGF